MSFSRSCLFFEIRYVGETALPFHKRANNDHKAKSGWEHMMRCFRNRPWYRLRK